MLSDRLRPLALIVLAGSIAGCASSADGGLHLGKADNWGEAYRQTFAAQIINPAPEYDDPIPLSSGARAVAALERYRTDAVKQPARQSLSTIGRQGGGSSGASASPSGGN